MSESAEDIRKFSPKVMPGYLMKDSLGDLRDLIKLIHAYPEDGLGRCQLAASCLLGFWQSAGPAWSSRPPSMLFVSDGGEDPLDRLCATFTGVDKPDETAAAPMPGAKPMRGRAGHFSDRWHKPGNVSTDDSLHAILRLDRDADKQAFMDVVKQYGALAFCAFGKGRMGPLTRKTLSYSGSIQSYQWSQELLERCMYKGLPVIFLPHAKPPVVPAAPPWWGTAGFLFAREWNDLRKSPIQNLLIEPTMGPFEKDCQRMGKQFREKLRMLPPECEFFHLKLMRELDEVSDRVASFLLRLATSQRSPGYEHAKAESDALAEDLRHLAFRGIALGVHSYAYRGIGLRVKCSHEKIHKVLETLREKGAMTRRDLQRRLQSLDAAALGQLLEVCEAESLVTFEGKMVEAVGFTDYVNGLSASSRYALPELRTKRLLENFEAGS